MVGVGVGKVPFDLSACWHVGERLSEGYGNALLIRATADSALVWRRFLAQEAPDAEWMGKVQ